eukprot:CAMPEP_0197316912 /NCGR_PEP_ID=MMETSP0891-20130614/44803_1 /TAXON_ID=44058 ORGANISM="Aureoumbra lagunensis, Strain CCMP1510" /NCGR_SAMPLE_ID=MMETSP0891 /ASSEMBLY_ACC=CAM_ASM_000534 /LENGTH=336 /DNA_ID=CAMNT_0042806623 /DNA_START=56 /DNA_END=1066 /DNA_ORIENTATION=-
MSMVRSRHLLESHLMDTKQSALLSQEDAGRRLAAWLYRYDKVLILTGAGISTESGIPDYRGRSGSYRLGHKPMTHDQFCSSQKNRVRYWSRALRGYEAFAASKPNAAHKAIATLQKYGKVSAVITQNVDGLHEKSYSKNIVALHGRADRNRCLTCGSTSCRASYHDKLKRINSHLLLKKESLQDSLRPDGDADIELSQAAAAAFTLPPCETCGTGVLKPDVVFFGDSVPRDRVNFCNDALNNSDALLVCGSSLAVYSSYRFVVAALSANKPVCILNIGKTRAEYEGLPVLKLEASVLALVNSLPLLGLQLNDDDTVVSIASAVADISDPSLVSSSP